MPELASVTVVGEDLPIVDASATAVFAMGLPGLSWLEQLPGFEAMAITDDGRLVSTLGFGAWTQQRSASGRLG